MSSLRITAWAAIFALLPAAGAMARPITTVAETNLRQSPGVGSAVLTLIPKGTRVEVGKCSNGWCQTSLNGQEGYAIAQNLGVAALRRAPRGPVYAEEEIIDDGPVVYGPPPAYVVGPAYYGYGPVFGFYGGWGWGRHW